MSDQHDLYRRWIDEVWAGRTPAREIVSDDFVGHWPDREVRGPDELQSVIDGTHGTFRDLGFTIELGPIVGGDLVAGRWVGHGRTDDGPSTFVGHDLLRVSGTKFVEYWVASYVR